MFERYTEKARRVVFFARYEASHYGSPYIEAEHLLLGLLREYGQLSLLLPSGAGEAIRTQIDSRFASVRPKIPTSVDLPLSNESKGVLAYGAEEAERLAHRHIGPEHLLLGLLREKDSFASGILRGQGASLEKLREHYARTLSPEGSNPPRLRTDLPILIHGLQCKSGTIGKRVRVLRQSNWYWQKKMWKARDVAVHKDGKLSFDMSLAADPEKFNLRRASWRIDHCTICEWELFETEDKPEHGAGYTNGRDWVCSECYDKFLSGPDYFATAYPEIT